MDDQAPRRVVEGITYSRLEDPERCLLSRERRSESGSRMSLPSGRELELARTEEGHDEIRIDGRGGEVELTIVLTPEGPQLRFASAQLSLSSVGKLEVDCDRLHVRSRRGIVQEAGGDLVQLAGGNARTAVRGDLEIRAREVELRSSRGDVRVRANDDVRLNGERVKLNCD